MLVCKSERGSYKIFTNKTKKDGLSACNGQNGIGSTLDTDTRAYKYTLLRTHSL